MNVSVLILTLDEEVNLEGCLKAVAWSNDVVVLDSFSTDKTVEIAQAHGARVVQRPFDNYAAQRNYGLRDVSYRNDWVLMLDADERATPELRAEIEQRLPTVPQATTLFYLRRKDFLLGRWIKRSSGYPTWFGRLARIGHVWVQRPINEEYCTSGRTERLAAHVEHFPFNKGFSAWVAKHDRYSSMEAQLMLGGGPRVPWRDCLCSEPSARRRAIKQLVYRVPGRPLLMFLALYVVRGGFLDGRAGLTFSLLRAWYEYMIDCKRQEQLRRIQGLPI